MCSYGECVAVEKFRHYRSIQEILGSIPGASVLP